MRMVIDVKSREEDESAANGPQWAARGGLFATGSFLRFLPRKLQHNSAGEQASQWYSGSKDSSAQWPFTICRHLSSWTRKICPPYKNSVKQNMERTTGLPNLFRTLQKRSVFPLLQPILSPQRGNRVSMRLVLRSRVEKAQELARRKAGQTSQC